MYDKPRQVISCTRSTIIYLSCSSIVPHSGILVLVLVHGTQIEPALDSTNESKLHRSNEIGRSYSARRTQRLRERSYMNFHVKNCTHAINSMVFTHERTVLGMPNADALPVDDCDYLLSCAQSCDGAIAAVSVSTQCLQLYDTK